MNEKQIEEFLRNNKPQLDQNPTFLLEARQKMREVEGIKAEVDRQRGYGRNVILITLFTGLLVGTAATAIAFLCPVNPSVLGEGLWKSLRLFLDAWKTYLMFPVAGCAVTLGILLGRGRRQGVRL
ncbi:MAG: hypothetical protein IJ636_00940 [Bacteroidales bacterium]|nr:hypothetical protein [Bacteroidales bacterium]